MRDAGFGAVSVIHQGLQIRVAPCLARLGSISSILFSSFVAVMRDSALPSSALSKSATVSHKQVQRVVAHLPA